MKRLAIIAALATLAVAAPAAAVVTTFASFGPISGANLRFVNSGTGASRANDAVYYTTATPTGTVAGAVSVNFSFLNSALSPFVTNVTSLYRLDAVVAKGSPAQLLGSLLVQGGISGTFSYLTTSAITVSGPGFVTTTYAAGSNLLSGSFSNASILATNGGTSGSSFASGLIGTNISFTSDFLLFAPGSGLDRSTTFTSITAASAVAANGALRSFRTVTGGTYSADPVPRAVSAVPEPANWIMLIAGFALVGVSARRNRAVAA
ncbi:PEPxxWA-CTERM sorting domain-containing protein [Sandarakinorhabdus sp.]|uniref:PEPxxWA-CTERM sorting domain-containing protein n=1 Tax=Sandarakinorhabdus sp. TaxID=1916663 RepID=UPI00286D8C98|nr:PEPxxWA-CTERM sorting domain-containing protein [Sandarakinorhabdus sp.]